LALDLVLSFKQEDFPLRNQVISLVALLIAFIFNPMQVQSSSSKLKEGQKFPNFKLTRLKTNRMPASSRPVTARSLRGKVALIDFWASWCGPCKVALPEYDKLYKKYKKRGFTIIGINVDDEKELVTQFLKEHPVSFPVAYDSKKKLVDQVGLATMPTSYLIDSKGKVQYIHRGFHRGDQEELEKKIVSLLKTKKSSRKKIRRRKKKKL